MPSVNLKVDGDVTTQWDTVVPGPNHWEAIDEGTTLGGNIPDDADYIETVTVADVDEFTVEATPPNTDTVSQVVVNLRGQIDDSAATARIQVDLFHSSGTPVTGNPKYVTGTNFGGYGVLGEYALTWSGLTLTKVQADSLQVRKTFLAS